VGILKIGINTITFAKEKPQKRLEMSREAGFEGVEILAHPEDLTQKRTRDMKNLLRRLGLEVVMIACGSKMASSRGELCLESPKMNIRDGTIQYVKKCVDWANEFDTDKIYIISPTEKNQVSDIEESLRWLNSSLQICCDYARSAGVKICIEHAPGKLVGKLTYLNQLIKEFGIENLGALIDIGHLNITKENLAQAVMNTDKIYHVHFDNNDGKNDFHTPLEIGTMHESDIADFVRALKQKKYEGYYSIELLNLQNPIETLKRNIRVLRDIYQSV
jgi:sugar phosphate isomerase/epimerase